MARRRFQKGCVYLRGDLWVGRYRKDQVTTSGMVERKLCYETLGTRKEYPTKRLAQRALEMKLAELNALSYRAKPSTSFEIFAKKWEQNILPNWKPSTQSAVRCQLRLHLIPKLGRTALSNLTGEQLQAFVTQSKLSPKTTKNLVATLHSMWNTAKVWRLVTHDPFDGLVLPERNLVEARCFTADEMKRIIEAAQEPYRTFFWLAAETGMRAGELCGLRWEDVDLDRGIVWIRQSSWRGKIGTPKTKTGQRTFAISPRLCSCLCTLPKQPNFELLFHARTGRPWDGNLIVKRKLHPILKKLGIEQAGLHAFRHGNATVMDQVDVPSRVRQTRLGHADIETTMGYTHVASADDQRAAAELERVIFGATKSEVPKTWTMPGGNA